MLVKLLLPCVCGVLLLGFYPQLHRLLCTLLWFVLKGSVIFKITLLWLCLKVLTIEVALGACRQGSLMYVFGLFVHAVPLQIAI